MENVVVIRLSKSTAYQKGANKEEALYNEVFMFLFSVHILANNALRAHHTTAHGGLLPHISPEDPVIFRIYILHVFNAGQMSTRGKFLLLLLCK